MSFPRKRAALAFAATALLAACGGDKSNPIAPPPPPPPSNPTYAKLTDLGGSGFGIARSSDGHLLVTLIDAGWVERVASASPLASHDGLNVGGTPSVVVTDPTGASFYVANMGGWVEGRSSTTGASLGSAAIADAHSLSVSPDGTRLYVAGSSGEIYVLNTSNFFKVATIPVPGGPWGIAYREHGGSWLYVTSRDAGRITEINRATNEVTRVFAVGGRPHGLAISKDGLRLFAADDSEGKVKTVDIQSGLVIRETPLAGAFSIAITPDGATLYAGTNDGEVAVITAATGAIMKKWDTGGQPRQITLSADGNTAYFANYFGWIDKVTR